MLGASLFGAAALAVAAQVFSAVTQETCGTTIEEIGGQPHKRVSITVKAHTGNTGVVYVSPFSGVTSGNGFELYAGEAYTWDWLGAAESRFYCIASAAGQKVSVEELRR